MSFYFMADEKRYRNEIIELGMEIYNSDAHGYYKGQAISALTNLYANEGNYNMAEKWLKKATSIFNSQEILYAKLTEGEEQLHDIGHCSYWLLEIWQELAELAVHNSMVKDDPVHQQSIYKTISDVYETLYKNDDMSFESFRKLCCIHLRIAQLETETTNDETVLRQHLERAAVCSEKSVSVCEHTLASPMLYGWKIEAAPADREQCVRLVLEMMNDAVFDPYRNKTWFINLCDRLAQRITE